MFCSNCKAEYREGFDICRDCNIPLVTELPKEPELEFVDFQELITTYNPFDISLLKSLLDAEGITYYFQGEHFSYVRPLAIPVRSSIFRGWQALRMPRTSPRKSLRWKRPGKLRSWIMNKALARWRLIFTVSQRTLNNVLI
jgi:hypothetical protein